MGRSELAIPDRHQVSRKMNTEQMNRNRLDAEMVEVATVLGKVVNNIPGFENEDVRDLHRSLAIILDNWEIEFRNDMLRCNVDYRFIDKARRIRNNWAHRSGRYQDTETTAEDIDALKELRRRLKPFKSTRPSSRGHHRNVQQRTAMRKQMKEQGRGRGWFLIMGSFFVVLIAVTLIGNTFLPQSTSGTVGFLFALVAAIAVHRAIN